MHDFLAFALVGFLAQLVDGSLGMAYGLTATAALLQFGVPPSHASAATHAAEVFTTAASGGAHMAHKNIDWSLFWRLAPAGAAGGAIGSYVLTSIDGKAVLPFVSAYLGLMGLFILYRTICPPPEGCFKRRYVAPLGLTGGFLDSVGGGGWGAVVTSTLMGAGEKPRYVIGTVSAVEFLVTVAISMSFLIALLTGHWKDAGYIGEHAAAVAGLVVGGLAAAPLGAYLVKRMAHRVIGTLVGLSIVALSFYQLSSYMKWL